MKVLIVDNYDSFTFNLYQEVGQVLQGASASGQLDVIRNDGIDLAELKKRAYDRIIISPGPGDPADPSYFGICAKVLTEIGKRTPVFGVCLGMQGMAHYFGGKVCKADVPMHGKTSVLLHDGKGVFAGLPDELEVMRYHSLIAEPQHLPSSLTVTAVVKTGSQVTLDAAGTSEIMGLRHKDYPIEGVQFHPESFATEGGRQMISNFLFQ